MTIKLSKQTISNITNAVYKKAKNLAKQAKRCHEAAGFLRSEAKQSRYEIL